MSKFFPQALRTGPHDRSHGDIVITTYQPEFAIRTVVYKDVEATRATIKGMTQAQRDELMKLLQGE